MGYGARALVQGLQQLHQRALNGRLELGTLERSG